MSHAVAQLEVLYAVAPLAHPPAEQPAVWVLSRSLLFGIRFMHELRTLVPHESSEADGAAGSQVAPQSLWVPAYRRSKYPTSLERAGYCGSSYLSNRVVAPVRTAAELKRRARRALERRLYLPTY